MRENFVVHPQYEPMAAQLRDALVHFTRKGEYVVKGDRNIIKRVNIGGEEFNIKKFKTPNPIQGLVYQSLRDSKAKRSFVFARRLMEAGINTPFPVAYFEQFYGGLKESYYISRHLNYDFDFRELLHNPRFENREEIVRQFAAFTYKLHENGVNFLDHSPGNTLIINRGDGRYDFFLIDLNRMRFEEMDFKKRMFNFRRLWLSRTLVKIISREYAKLYSRDYDEVHELMLKYSRQFQKKVNSGKMRKRRRR